MGYCLLLKSNGTFHWFNLIFFNLSNCFCNFRTLPWSWTHEHQQWTSEMDHRWICASIHRGKSLYSCLILLIFQKLHIRRIPRFLEYIQGSNFMEASQDPDFACWQLLWMIFLGLCFAVAKITLPNFCVNLKAYCESRVSHEPTGLTQLGI